MEAFIIPLIMLGLVVVLSGPIALIISLTTMNKVNKFERMLKTRVKAKKAAAVKAPDKPITPVPATPMHQAEDTGGASISELKKPVIPKEPKVLTGIEMQKPVTGKTSRPQPVKDIGSAGGIELQERKKYNEEEPETVAAAVTTTDDENVSLEQIIGTRWIMIAGVVTVFFAVGFFLKYAYETFTTPDIVKVLVVTAFGFAALITGEITRRRDYGIVAKGVTALGFAILYAAVFAAYRFYGLIGLAPGFALAIAITSAAMAYAFVLDEMLIALISLLGGYVTPVIVSTGQNKPVLLFSYVLILSIGAILCGYRKKWAPVNFVAMAGTYLLYAGWFFTFYELSVPEGAANPQSIIAIWWLWLFFAIYLVLPILYEFTKNIKAQTINVLLVATNSAVTFFFLWNILHDQHRYWLGASAIALGAAHLFVMWLMHLKGSEDDELKSILLTIGLSFITIAVPLYLKAHGIAMAWTIEAIVLVTIGLRYNSRITRYIGGAAYLFSLACLTYHLPMHNESFRLILNPPFFTWCLAAIAAYIIHLLYRTTDLDEDLSNQVSQVAYLVSAAVLMLASLMEWYWHCEYNFQGSYGTEAHFAKGVIIMVTFIMLALVAEPISPKGKMCKGFSALIALIASLYTVISFNYIYHRSFAIFANHEFMIGMLFTAGLFATAWLLKRKKYAEENDPLLPMLFFFAAIVFLWTILTQQIYLYFRCLNQYGQGLDDWRFMAHMYISIMWAVYGALLMLIGFWKKSATLRYIALGIFALLLGKVFIFDTSEMENVYRIAAFLATGLVLVGVSYLYQFLKNKGFFEALLEESTVSNDED